MPMTAKETRTLIAFIVALAAVSGGATDHSFTLCPSDGNVCHEVDTSRGVALSGYLERRRKQEEGHLFLETVANAELIVLVNFINTVPYLGTVDGVPRFDVAMWNSNVQLTTMEPDQRPRPVCSQPQETSTFAFS
ncbi:Reelin domain-containing protein [Plasmodiophora brassicae]|uniref:Reelin domain-containing protein n=1 Tax=Plasmodiophora brassicae TaxID=37360 RepID=A0A3P3YN66_PLABS|nr:unnamed protein product [Plasmodiophora brassicae]